MREPAVPQENGLVVAPAAKTFITMVEIVEKIIRLGLRENRIVSCRNDMVWLVSSGGDSVTTTPVSVHAIVNNLQGRIFYREEMCVG